MKREASGSVSPQARNCRAGSAAFVPPFILTLTPLLLLLLALAGCAGTASPSGRLTEPMPPPSPPGQSCAPVAAMGRLPAANDANAGQGPVLRPLPHIPLRSQFSATSLETAQTIGVLPELATIASARNSGLPFEQLLLARQRVVERITLAMLDISSVTAELDCENERGDQLRDQLQTLEQQRARSLTVASLVLGAATAIISGGITLASPDAVSASATNIVGGSAQAATSFAALASTTKGRLQHERNLLTDLWQGRRESEMYPATIWRFLHRPRANEQPGEHASALREDLIAHWKSAVRLGVTDHAGEQQRVQLIFGTGGEYGVDDLRARRAILDQLKATVRLLYQELELLLLEVARDPGRSPAAGARVQ